MYASFVSDAPASAVSLSLDMGLALIHDLKTPLICQKQLIDMLQSGSTTSTDTVFRGLYENNRHLLQLVDLLLETYQYQNNDLPLHFKSVNINQLIIKTNDHLSAWARQKNITLTYQPNLELPLIWADEMALRRVLENIVGNAIYALKSGQLIAVICRIDDALQQLHIAIEDNGPGIDESQQPELFNFDLFKTPPLNFRRVCIKTGLGLAICKAIVSRHQGTICAQNRLNGGARFLIKLPLSSA